MWSSSSNQTFNCFLVYANFTVMPLDVLTEIADWYCLYNTTANSTKIIISRWSSSSTQNFNCFLVYHNFVARPLTAVDSNHGSLLPLQFTMSLLTKALKGMYQKLYLVPQAGFGLKRIDTTNLSRSTINALELNQFQPSVAFHIETSQGSTTLLCGLQDRNFLSCNL